MRLTQIYEQMQREAARNGRSTAQLRGGVRVTLVMSREKQTIAVWRRGKKLGDTEIITFREHFAIPSGSRRLPNSGQQERKEYVTVEEDGALGEVRWYGVAWQWGCGGNG